MDASLLLPALFLIGCIAGFAGNFISGGNSLIALSGMLALGIPPHLAMSTHVMGGIGWRIGGFWQFLRARKIIWSLVLPLSCAALLGSALGAHILLSIDEALARKMAGLLIIALAPMALLKKDLGIERKKVLQTRKICGYVVYFLLSIWAGFFSAGMGALFLYTYMWFFGITVLEIKGTDKIPGFFFGIGALAIFLAGGAWNLSYFLAFAPGAFLGGAMGASGALKLGDRGLKPTIVLSAALMGLYLFLK